LKMVSMEHIIRSGMPSDIDEIVRIYGEKEHFFSIIFSSDYEAALQFHVKNLRKILCEATNDGAFRVFVAEMPAGGGILGYLILHIGTVESITGKTQSAIYDYGVSRGYDDMAVFQALLREAEEATVQRDIFFMVTEVFREDKRGEKIFMECGFKKEINLVIKRTAMNVINAPDPDPFRVRIACNEDIFFVMWLSTQCSSFTVPSGRDADTSEIQFEYLRVYSGMSLKETDDFAALIIEDALEDEPIGYLLLKTNSHDLVLGQRLAYVYDISIHPDYWGKWAAQRLYKEGENLLVRKGIHFCLGDISEDNRRALLAATRTAGFKLERSRIVKKLQKC
jgi:ribosomal protein S18 acetylase RimI-like enzyme